MKSPIGLSFWVHVYMLKWKVFMSSSNFLYEPIRPLEYLPGKLRLRFPLYEKSYIVKHLGTFMYMCGLNCRPWAAEGRCRRHLPKQVFLSKWKVFMSNSSNFHNVTIMLVPTSAFGPWANRGVQRLRPGESLIPGDGLPIVICNSSRYLIFCRLAAITINKVKEMAKNQLVHRSLRISDPRGRRRWTTRLAQEPKALVLL